MATERRSAPSTSAPSRRPRPAAATRGSRSHEAAARGRRPHDAAASGREGWQVRPLASVGGPVRLALTLSFAGIALAGAAWRAGRRG